jgi:hypothetical protein
MAISETISFFFTPTSQAQIDTVMFDCSLEESHNYTANITDYPQENGFYVQDNVWLEPFKLNIKGIVSDTQLVPFGSDFGILQRRVDDVYDSLMALRDNRDVFQVMTGLKIYQNMIFTSLTLERDQETGYSMRISAEIKQLKKVASQNNINNESTNDKSFPNNQNNGSQQMQSVNTDDIPQQDKDDLSETYGIEL